MNVMPVVAVLATYPVQIGACTFAAPLEGVVIHKFARHRVVSIAQGFRTEGSNHLRVAVVATLTHINIAPCQFQRRQRVDAFQGLGGGTLKKEWHDFHQATNCDDQHNEHHHQKAVGFNFFMAKALGFLIRHA